MKRLIGLTFASAIVLNVNAQSASDGFSMIQYKKYESAVNAMKSLANNNPEAAIALGLAYLELEQVEDAKAAFAKVPEKEEWLRSIGQAYIYGYDKNAAQVETVLNSVVDKARKKDWEKYKYAADVIAFTGIGNFDKAVEWYTKSLSIEENAATHLNLGYLYMNRLNNGGEAYRSFNKAAESPNKEIKSLAFNYLGSLGLRSRNAELAISNFDKSKAADPANPMPFLQLAKQYDKIGKTALAKENVEQFYANSDKRYIDKIDYVNILIGAKEFGKAEGILDELLKTNANKATLYRAMAYAQYETEKYDEAVKNINIYFNKTTDKSTITVEDFSYAGKIYASLAKNDEEKEAEYIAKADEYFSKAIAADTASSKRETYLEIAKIFQSINNFKSAAKYYEMIIKENPGKTSTTDFDYFNVGLTNYYAGNLDKALETFTKLTELSPEEPIAVYWQGRSAMAMDKEAKTGAAEPYFTKWLSMNKEGYTRSDRDKITAYAYMAEYNYNAKQFAKAIEAADAILEIDADNEFAMQIKEYSKN